MSPEFNLQNSVEKLRSAEVIQDEAQREVVAYFEELQESEARIHIKGIPSTTTLPVEQEFGGVAYYEIICGIKTDENGVKKQWELEDGIVKRVKRTRRGVFAEIGYGDNGASVTFPISGISELDVLDADIAQ